MIQYMTSEGFVKDFGRTPRRRPGQPADPWKNIAMISAKKADRTAEMAAANCDKNSTEVRYPSMSNIVLALQTNSSNLIGPARPTRRPLLHHCSKARCLGNVAT